MAKMVTTVRSVGGGHQADVEAAWDHMGLMMAFGSGPFSQLLATLKMRMTAGAASGAAALKWVHLLSPATGWLGRRRPCPLDLTEC